MPVALRLLDTTDRAFRLVVSDSPLAGLIRTKILARIAAFAMSLKPVQAIAFRIVSQTGIHYRNGPLSEPLEGIPHSAPRAGDRLPWLQLEFEVNGTVEDSFQKLDDMHFNLVVIGQPPPPEGAIGLGDRLRHHVIPLILSMRWNWHARRLCSPLLFAASRRPCGTLRGSPGSCGNHTLRLRALCPQWHLADISADG